ncbi:MAG: SagB/ThcOx family dehydrogenase [Desulfobacterales bacterium]|nr:MAG: SagB/ThcOx family dehydrogenase [Desulfobacterales bacterium]
MDHQAFQEVVHYHEATKHHLHRYAKSLGYMDWQNQPNPFRSYEGAVSIPLPLLKEDPPAGYLELYQRDERQTQPFQVKTVAGFLELSLGLSAWKAAAGSQWSLRINPSSGNLHPTEAHLILPPLDSIASGVYHYNPLMHTLEKRAEVPAEWWQEMGRHFDTHGFLMGLSSIFWRESWKYGERAFRYCNHDVGHALAGISLAANLFGWKATYLNGLSHAKIATVLGLDQTRFPHLEAEDPELLCWIHHGSGMDIPRSLPEEIIAGFATLEFTGQPNTLSRECVNWEIIYKTARLTGKPDTPDRKYDFAPSGGINAAVASSSAAAIIRRRRSATSFDGRGAVTSNQFLSMLEKTIPRQDCPPFDAELMEPSVHLLLFVHRVREMAPGLYFFFRNDHDAGPIKRSARSDFLWKPVLEGLPLYLLEEGDFRHEAMRVSCHQEIAGSGAFSLGMIAKFRDLIQHEPYRYRHLYWETGMIGQVLYLEAEAHGVRGTGIGCFFDDAVHAIMGLKDNHYQSLYHFTIGHPVEDPRLTTYPPYHHLQNR